MFMHGLDTMPSAGYEINGRLQHSMNILTLEAYSNRGAFRKNHGTENNADRFVGGGLEVSR